MFVKYYMVILQIIEYQFYLREIILSKGILLINLFFFRYIEKEETMINKFRNMYEDIVSNYLSQVKNKSKNLEKK